MIIIRKSFSVYDDTDNIKRMKDSDILAAKPKDTPGYSGVLSSAAAGATMGALAGSVGKGFLGKSGTFGKRFVKGGKYGAIIGGLASGALALNNRNKIERENQFYNDRLAQAQRWAARRERIDWKRNITGREGYSY